MELESGSSSVERWCDREAGGARAAAASGSVGGACAGERRCAVLRSTRSTHTSPDTWATTLTKTPTATVSRAHEVSKPSVTVARWSAERIGPTIIAAPHRGHAHVAQVAVVGGHRRGRVRGGGRRRGVASRVRASATRAVRQVFARKPDCRMRTKPRGRMCWTKRRRNSMAVSVIVRRCVAVGVVLPVKGHALAIEGEQAVIADRDAMGVAPEIAQDGGRPTEGRLGVDDPVGLEERVDEGVPLRRVAQVLAAAGEVEFVPVVRASERLDKLPAKDATEDLHGQEEAGVLRANPALVIGREAAGRHDAVDVGMPDQRLPPRVEDAEDADLRAEMARVGGDLAERRRARLKEPGVQTRRCSDRPAAGAHAGA